MTMITGTRSESTVVLWGVTGVEIADFRVELRYIELDDRYQLFGIYIIGERARHYQGCTNSSWCGTYIYIYIYMYGGTYVIIVAHAMHT